MPYLISRIQQNPQPFHSPGFTDKQKKQDLTPGDATKGKLLLPPKPLLLVVCTWDSPDGQGSRTYVTSQAGCCPAGMKIRPNLQYEPVIAKRSDGQDGSRMPRTTEKMVAPLPHLCSVSASHCSSVKGVNGKFPSVLGVLAEATSWGPFLHDIRTRLQKLIFLHKQILTVLNLTFRG